MPAKSKIFGEMEVKVRELCEKGYNATHIGKQVGLAKDTIKTWAQKNGFQLSTKISSKTIDLEPKILEMLRDNIPRKQIQRTLDVHFTTITEIAIEYGLEDKLRTRKESALDRILTDEEVTSRIPDESRYIGYNKSKRKYGFICSKTNREFYKFVGKIDQGSPYNKSGYVLTEQDYVERLKAINHTIERGTFIKTKDAVIVYCSKGHRRDLKRASYAFKFECSVCSNNGTSKAENEILNWVRQYYPFAVKFKFEKGN